MERKVRKVRKGKKVRKERKHKDLFLIMIFQAAQSAQSASLRRIPNLMEVNKKVKLLLMPIKQKWKNQIRKKKIKL